MLYKKILVPFDGSDHAMKAVDAACEILRDDTDAQMRIITIVPAPAVSLIDVTRDSWNDLVPPVALMDMNDYVKVISQRVESEREKLAETVGSLIAEFGDRAQIDAIPNLSAIEGITEYAEKNDVDLIIMGRRGLGAFRGALGSVSYGILRATDVPVLTIK
ncbi:MAG: universal stress protein [Coriobacteriaceae bacterium]|nr:universal stress protein [Coriobacteriaceae bacterium]MDY3799748.1 universal stress protein [Eggerthellaceae bacterium]MDD6636162.1 universal stress protein [Coriobacteriaceae bacterium]MDD7430688.1 universal stress protein [Coriobacteriaceae bacterium]MDO4498458.1 universal stress protein [Coriobacteriaceae bacterium]